MDTENTPIVERQHEVVSHTFSLTDFKKQMDGMIASSDEKINSFIAQYLNQSVRPTKDYTREDIINIINSGDLNKQITLSRNYFNKNGFYKRIILHYATLLMYCGLVIPKLSYGEEFKDTQKKKYYNVINYIEINNLPNLQINWVIRALRDGCYYGIISANDEKLVVIDLPVNYCSTSYTDSDGNDLIDFSLRYFDEYKDKEVQQQILSVFPKFISKAYKKYTLNNGPAVVRIPSEYGICLPILDSRPFFMNVITAAIDYEEAIALAKAREADEIRKIIIQKIPHLTDGQLLFEPDEAKVMHDGTVKMMKGNPNVNILTTYADVDSVVSKTSTENQNNFQESMANNIYYEAGASGQIFGSNSNMALETSLRNDLALTSIFSHKLENIISNILNVRFKNYKITYKYIILPITYYNADEYINNSFKLASSGYSFILPVLGLGLTSTSLSTLKKIEQDIFKLDDLLLPLTSAYTQSGNGSLKKPANNPGAPKKATEDKKPHTLETEKSLDKQGIN